MSHNILDSGNPETPKFFQILSSLPKLRYLNLSDNSLKGIHTSMLEAGSFSELRELDFRSNKVDD